MTPPVLQDIGEVHELRDRSPRERWISFTKKMSLPLGPDEIARELAEYLVPTFDLTCCAVYLDGGDATYRLNARAGEARFVRTIEQTAAQAWVRLKTVPVPVPPSMLPSLTAPALPAALAIALRWRDMLVGFVVIGRSHPDGSDFDGPLLAAVADQAATAIIAARLYQTTASPPSRPLHVVTPAIHDLKNSVSALSLLVRNAATCFDDPEFRSDAVTTVARTVDRMQHLLATLMSSPADPPSERREPIDLGALIREATAPLAVHPHIRLVRRLAPVHIEGDRGSLLRVIENLVANAVEAIEREGTITVALAQTDGRAVMSVSDTGRGMSSDYLENHLFTPFHSTKKGGWGLGLHQTKEIVERQNGEIFVESVGGLGTTFTVKLPLHADSTSPSLESAR